MKYFWPKPKFHLPMEGKEGRHEPHERKNLLAQKGNNWIQDKIEMMGKWEMFNVAQQLLFRANHFTSPLSLLGLYFYLAFLLGCIQMILSSLCHIYTSNIYYRWNFTPGILLETTISRILWLEEKDEDNSNHFLSALMIVVIVDISIVVGCILMWC